MNIYSLRYIRRGVGVLYWFRSGHGRCGYHHIPGSAVRSAASLEFQGYGGNQVTVAGSSFFEILFFDIRNRIHHAEKIRSAPVASSTASRLVKETCFSSSRSRPDILHGKQLPHRSGIRLRFSSPARLFSRLHATSSLPPTPAPARTQLMLPLPAYNLNGPAQGYFTDRLCGFLGKTKHCFPPPSICQG